MTVRITSDKKTKLYTITLPEQNLSVLHTSLPTPWLFANYRISISLRSTNCNKLLLKHKNLILWLNIKIERRSGMFNTFEFIGTSFLRPDIIWFLAGLIMLLIEFIAPGIFFLFFAIGAWVVVILTLVFDMPLSMQLLSFSWYFPSLHLWFCASSSRRFLPEINRITSPSTMSLSAPGTHCQ